MKKEHFFYQALIFGLLFTLIFSACKDDPTPPNVEPNYDTTVLKSKSFEVIDLFDSVAGSYQHHLEDNVTPFGDGSLVCKYVLHNIAGDSVQYVVMLKKLQNIPTHSIQYCIGSSCSKTKVSSVSNVVSTKDVEALFFGVDAYTNPDIDSYIKLWAGANFMSAVPGIDRFRIIYYNAKDKTDFVSFVLTYNFTE